MLTACLFIKVKSSKDMNYVVANLVTIAMISVELQCDSKK